MTHHPTYPQKADFVILNLEECFRKRLRCNPTIGDTSMATTKKPAAKKPAAKKPAAKKPAMKKAAAPAKKAAKPAPEGKDQLKRYLTEVAS